MDKHLFLFTITPVQSFIEQARKTQDLYAGSFLLSHLCKVAAEKAHNDYNAYIIFPKIRNESIPNRFIAIVNGRSDDLKRIGREIEDTVCNEFKDIADNIIANLSISPVNGFNDQINNLFIINWIFIPLGRDDYPQKYKEIESLLGAIKNVRVFNQLPEKGRKCSICGERNVKFYRKTKVDEGKKYEKDIYDFKLFNYDVKIFKRNGNEPLAQKYLQQGEGLCAVCFTKRCLDHAKEWTGYEKDFPSTAEVALMETLHKLEKDEKGKRLLIDYKNLFKNYHFDEQLYYEENLTDKYFEKYGYEGLKPNVAEIRKKQKEISDFAKNKKCDITKYYSILIFDGDSMGRWLSGEFLKDKSQLEQFHRALTERLSEFANRSKDILKEPKGKVVYAGGDDFLGLVNLKHLFGTIKEFRESFHNEVSKKLKSYFKDDAVNLTFSAGIAIAHYKIPLKEVLAWVRKMEKEAKDIDSKDAFGIAVLKHSGGIEKVVYKLRVDNVWVVDIMSNILKKLDDEEFSDTFIKKLNGEMKIFIDENNPCVISHNIIRTELKRLLSRSCIRLQGETEKEFEKRKQRDVEHIGNDLLNLLRIDKKGGLKNLLPLLNIIDFMHRKATRDY